MSKESDIKLLRAIELEIAADMARLVSPAGNAFLADDVEEMRFWKGQHTGLDRIRRRIQDKWLKKSITKTQRKREAKND